MVDEKGKLFGKINIIDLLVLLLIVIVAVVVGIKVLGRGGGVPGASGGTKVVYTVKVNRVEPAVYEALKAHVDAGDAQLMANGEMLNGNITAVASSVHRESVQAADGSIINSEDPTYVDLLFTIEAYVTNTVTQEVGTQEVRIGKNHIVKTDSFELVGGTIITCEQVEEPAA